MDKQGRLLLLVALVVLLAMAALAVYAWTGREGPEADDLGSKLLPQPTPTIYPDSTAVIRSVQKLSRLETVSYHVERVITAESGQGPLGFLFGDRLLLIAYGEVIAGVDLSKVDATSVSVTADGTAYLRLPPVEIFVATLNNEETRVYDRRTGVVGLNPDLETAARREAERLILEAALEDGIEADAGANAEEFLRSFLLALGFEEVLFVDELPTPTPIPTLTPAPEADGSSV